MMGAPAIHTTTNGNGNTDGAPPPPSTTTLIPEIDISSFLECDNASSIGSSDAKPSQPTKGADGVYDYHGLYPDQVISSCQKLARCLKENGILIIRDPRVSEDDNNRFLNMMEDYFEQDEQIILRDARPQWFYQVGVTPAGVERPRCATDPECLKDIDNQEPWNRAQVCIHISLRVICSLRT